MGFTEEMIENAGRAPGHQAEPTLGAAVTMYTGIHRINTILFRTLPLKVKIRQQRQMLLIVKGNARQQGF